MPLRSKGLRRPRGTSTQKPEDEVRMWHKPVSRSYIKHTLVGYHRGTTNLLLLSLLR
ncbi:hypothetical protein CCHR01_14809 [Colletotrichum chrysophilum]|uniref:Uncharacterized protein n=1 Tax=Colletotrichum chrysophilum TaxID=1836956 RepID=A0AAD9A7G4_9PEZI|nr:hypothetical protein CCHR01_14809 [Colletotrichum chrysophilum]